MPTILRAEGFVFFFYSNEGDEPAHVHVERGDGAAKFWLDPVSEAPGSRGMKAQETKRAQQIVEENQANFLKEWKEYHG